MVTLACPRVGAEKTRLRPSIGGTRLPSQLMAAPSPRGEPAARFYPFAESRRLEGSAVVTTDALRKSFGLNCQAGLPGRRRLRQRHLSAQQEIRCSEYSAASSVLAF